MSDALLTEISKKLSDIHLALKGASAGSRPATPPAGAAAARPAGAPGTTAPKPGTTAPKTGAAAGNKAAGAAPAAGTKAPGGKHTAEEVRDIIKKVATNANLGKQAAINILDENAGVQNVSSVKPENFDAVYEACEVELNGLAGGNAEGADLSDDPLA